MKDLFKVLLLFSFFLFTSCSKEVFNEDKCNEVSMKCYRGFPRACNKLKTKCSGIKVTYTKEVCQKALGQLVLGKPLKTLKDIYGNKIVGCFTKNDLAKFSQ